jgi:hypothetical protein
MSAAPEDEITEEQFLDTVAVIGSADVALSPLGSAILAAIDLGVAKDSRTFSRKLGIEHAIVLREVTALSNELGFLTVIARNDRTQRSELALSEKGRHLLSRAFVSK